MKKLTIENGKQTVDDNNKSLLERKLEYSASLPWRSN